MSLRAAINAMCKSCTYDPLDQGTCAQQIACCSNRSCELYAKRPITTKAIPIELLTGYGMSPEDLDDRARVLVVPMKSSSREVQNEPLLSAEFTPDSEKGRGCGYI